MPEDNSNTNQNNPTMGQFSPVLPTVVPPTSGPTSSTPTPTDATTPAAPIDLNPTPSSPMNDATPPAMPPTNTPDPLPTPTVPGAPDFSSSAVVNPTLPPAEPASAETNPADSIMGQVANKISESKNVLIALSSDPSVDEMAAAIGLSLFLDKLGKRATAIYSGATPNALEFLKPEETFEPSADTLQDFVIALSKEKADHLRYKLDGDYVKIYITPYKTRLSAEDLDFSYGDYNVDLVLALNVANGIDLDSALREHGRIMHDASIINITTGNPGKFGEIEWSDKNASSVSEMIADLLLSAKDVKIEKEEATAFLTGIVAATNRFSNNRTTPETMQIASRLMECGANQQLVSKNITPDVDNKMATVEANATDNASVSATSELASPDDPTQLEIGHGNKEQEPSNDSKEVEGDINDKTSTLLSDLEAAEATLAEAGAETTPEEKSTKLEINDQDADATLLPASEPASKEPTPEPATEPEPEPTPEPTPDPTPVPTPKLESEPTKEPTPEPEPEPVSEPKPEEPTPEPVPEKPAPEPEPIPKPEPTPAPKPEPTPAPEPTPKPKPAPETTEPVPEPAPTLAPEPASKPDLGTVEAPAAPEIPTSTLKLPPMPELTAPAPQIISNHAPLSTPEPASAPAPDLTTPSAEPDESGSASASSNAADVSQFSIPEEKHEKVIEAPSDLESSIESGEEPESKYGHMLEEALSSINEAATAIPPNPITSNPAAAGAPTVPTSPEINGVPEINYGPMPGENILPPPPPPPVELSSDPTSGLPLPSTSTSPLTPPIQPAIPTPATSPNTTPTAPIPSATPAAPTLPNPQATPQTQSAPQTPDVGAFKIPGM